MCHYMPITDIYAREILDSRGNPAVEVEILAEDGSVGRASVPSAALAGRKEISRGRAEMERDGGPDIGKTCYFVNTILAAAMVGENVYAQSSIDRILCKEDGTPDKSRLGAEGILGVSIAAAVTAAKSLKMPLFRYLGGAFARRLPVPMVNLLNGGSCAANTVDLREFMIMPCGAETFSEGLRMCAAVYHTLREELFRRNLCSGVGDNGGFAPELADTENALTLILQAVEKTGLRPGQDIALALNAAAGDLYDGERKLYVFPGESRNKGHEVCRSTAEMIEWIERLCQGFPIMSVEDGLRENDQEGWKSMTARLGGRIQLAKDSLFASGEERIRQEIKTHAGNSALIKISQAGTLTEAFAAVELARRSGWSTIISHCNGDTEDSFIADLAVAVGSGRFKAGAPCRSEHAAKYNRLLRREDVLGREALFGPALG